MKQIRNCEIWETRTCLKRNTMKRNNFMVPSEGIPHTYYTGYYQNGIFSQSLTIPSLHYYTSTKNLLSKKQSTRLSLQLDELEAISLHCFMEKLHIFRAKWKNRMKNRSSKVMCCCFSIFYIAFCTGSVPCYEALKQFHFIYFLYFLCSYGDLFMRTQELLYLSVFTCSFNP